MGRGTYILDIDFLSTELIEVVVWVEQHIFYISISCTLN